MNRNEYSMGAFAPPGCEWQNGKTAPTIRFVNEASVYLSQETNSELTEYIEKLKSGEEVLTNWLTVEEYLNSKK